LVSRERNFAILLRNSRANPKNEREACKTFIAGFDSRRRLRSQRIRKFSSHEARVLQTFVVCLVTLRRNSNDRGKGLSDEGKGLLGMGLRARNLVSIF